MRENMTPGITRRPGVRGDRPCIAGTGLRVTDIVMAEQYGECTPDEIVAELEISLEQVAAALNYYEKNRAYIDADIQRQFETFDKLAKAGYGRPSASLLPR